MAADIEHIFQDFILNKIREIEDQKEDRGVCAGAAVDGAGQDPAQGPGLGPDVGPVPGPGPDPVQEHAHKKHKKPKKHKSKKKKNRERDSGSESGTDAERDRRGTSPQTSKDPGDDGDSRSRSHHSTGKKKKKKKKKRRRRKGEDSSDSDGKQEESSSLRRQEDLPDIIPKQDNSAKGRGDEDRRSPSPSTQRSSPTPQSATSGPCETRPALEEPPQSTQNESGGLETTTVALEVVQKNEEPEEQDAAALVPTSSEPGNTSTQQEAPPSTPPVKRSKKPSRSPLRSKDAKSSKKRRRSKSPPRRYRRGSRSKSPSHKKRSRSKSPSHKKRSRSKSPSHKKRSRSKSPSHKKRSRSKSPSHRKRPCSKSPSHKKKSRSKSPSHKKKSRSKSPSHKKRSRSKSPSHKKKSRSKSPSHRKRPCSKSPSHKKKSRSKSPSHKKKSRSKSPSHKKRSRSKSPSHKKRSRSKSPSHRKRSRSKSPSHKKRSRSKSPSHKKRSRSKSPSHRKRSRSKSPSHKKRSRSKSPSHRKRSRSRSGGRRSSRRSRSRSASRSRKRVTYSQRDRWKREPSHSPVLILRKNRSPSRKHCSPQRISDLDKEQLLEIAKANAAAMCAKAGMPVPASLRTSMLPLALPSMAMNAAMASMTAATVTAALSNMSTLSSLLPLPSISNKSPSSSTQPSTTLEEVRRRVEKQANSLSIKEFTDKCQMIVDSSAELPVALPHVSDEEDDGKSFAASTLREQKVINFSINNLTVRPAGRSDADMAKEFPVSSGSQHRKKEGEGAYGEWVPVEKSCEKTSRKAPAHTSPGAEPPAEVQVQPEENVFPEPLLQSVDITQAVTERIRAQRRLAENPYDITAICMLSRAQEQVDAWAQSNTVPGLFTGSTGAQVLSSEELSSSGPQAWLKKDQFLRAAPVSGGVGEFLMRKMGWRTGEGLGRNREGTVEPIVIDFKVDRKGLLAEGEKPQKQTGGLVVTKDLMGKHPVSALIELCNKRRIMQPDFVMVHHSGPDHRKNFLFKVTVNGVDYQPQTASPNKKHAKAMAATVALQALGEVSSDGPGLYTGPVFTAASTGPLFST